MEEVGSAVGMLMAGMPELRGTAGTGAPDSDSCIQTHDNAADSRTQRTLEAAPGVAPAAQVSRTAMRTDHAERGQLQL